MKEIYLQPLPLDYENPYKTNKQAFIAFLGYFLTDRERSVSIDQWTEHVRESNLQARILLDQISRLIQDPPEDLLHILEYHGGVYLYHTENNTGETTQYTLDEGLTWVKDLFNELKDIEQKERNSPEGFLREFLIKFWSGKSAEEARREWKKYSKENPQESRTVLAKMTSLADNPQENLSELLWTYGRISLEHESRAAPPGTDDLASHWLKEVLIKFSQH